MPGAELNNASVVLKDAQAPLVLALDIGTSSVRAALFDRMGREIEGAEFRLTRGLVTTPDGGSEIDADEAVRQVVQAIDGLCATVGTPDVQIAGVGVSCFWHSIVGVDQEGNAVTPVYSWADTRAANDAESLRGADDAEIFYQRTGARFHPSYWPAKLLWIRRTAPETYRRVACWQSFSDLLFQRFFGHNRTSVSMASGTGLLNRFTCEWDQSLAEKLGLRVDALPKIAPERETFDELSPNFARRWPQLAGARWALAIGDGAANNVGAGCVSSDCISLMIGTSGAMRLLLNGKPPERLESGLWCYRLDRNRPVVGGALSDGGGLYAWLINALQVGSDLKKLESELSEMLPDQHGLTLMPFWTGERSTGWHEDARGAILGLTLHTRPVEILRAAMEAVAYRFALITEALTRSAPDASIIASGGALNASPTWTQILSDVIGRPLILSVATEASSRGAALYALETIGAIEGVASAPPVSGRAFYPDVENHERYRAGLARQQAVYERLVADETISRLLSGAIG